MYGGAALKGYVVPPSRVVVDVQRCVYGGVVLMIVCFLREKVPRCLVNVRVGSQYVCYEPVIWSHVCSQAVILLFFFSSTTISPILSPLSSSPHSPTSSL